MVGERGAGGHSSEKWKSELIVSLVLMRSADLLCHPASNSRQADQRGSWLTHTDFLGVDRQQQYVGHIKKRSQHAKAPDTNTQQYKHTCSPTYIFKERQLVAGHLTSQVTCQHTFKQSAVAVPYCPLAAVGNKEDISSTVFTHCHQSVVTLPVEFITLWSTHSYLKWFLMWVHMSSARWNKVH